jgi:aryl-alcohol dehydrogenase-like predicted oxidoreductase
MQPAATTGERIRLGDTEVCRIGLGTNRLHDTNKNVAFIRAAIDAGVQMIDTAHLYTGGESERAIGRALSTQVPAPGTPHSVSVVATKGGYGGAGRGKPDVLRKEIDQSLTSLRVDRVALYYLHRVDPETPIEESLGAIKEYVDRGAIERVGVSKVDIPLIERARKVLPIAAVQNAYNLDDRASDDVVDYCAREGIVFVPYYPLGAEPSRELRETARRHRATPQQMMLAWLLKRSPAMLPIPGTLSLEHLQANLGALSLEVSDKEFDYIASG